MSGPLAELLFLVLVAAIMFALVRPGSKAGTAIPLVTSTLAAVVGTATGYTARSA